MHRRVVDEVLPHFCVPVPIPIAKNSRDPIGQPDMPGKITQDIRTKRDRNTESLSLPIGSHELTEQDCEEELAIGKQ